MKQDALSSSAQLLGGQGSGVILPSASTMHLGMGGFAEMYIEVCARKYLSG